jgi:hypothetical protein
MDRDLYDLRPEDLAKARMTAGSLGEVLDALEEDRQYLLQGEAFTPDVIETWLRLQAHAGVRPDPPAAAPMGVRSVLRHLGLSKRIGRLSRSWNAGCASARTASFPCRRSLVLGEMSAHALWHNVLFLWGRAVVPCGRLRVRRALILAAVAGL